jgi:hypothetical protein
MMTKSLFDNFRGFESDPCYRGVQGSHFEAREGVYHGFEAISLDESLLDMLDNILNPMEEDMFNPLLAYNQTFTIEYTKQDGTLSKMTGTLFAPDYKGTPADALAYCTLLLEKDWVPLWTDKGWRSFYQSKVVSFHFGEDN